MKLSFYLSFISDLETSEFSKGVRKYQISILDFRQKYDLLILSESQWQQHRGENQRDKNQKNFKMDPQNPQKIIFVVVVVVFA